ncbi:MAG: hypothetical protein EIB84_04325 [Spiroplasma poulsonii]|uniref:GDSL-like Lipase/Acylhydrolase n=1 Tax=Spiroplasma poulsonii TaxID=2138 RepID=A0A2P6FER7_9MOLU|nr:SGNH/GDSL hydrolase family protein [Spiroplasma poulsonii]KAF0850311.1 GDSL-like Lipase/Acylhydrolase [Spiroplasma poulsonii]MBW1242062.1 hypothetical protein [Spiroplasma poulsonii]PQM31958.1 GDSL-like Lipase/Acylhydrolase [Spiroplasma poulsonii]PWF94427.1 GDSL-like Lipase/Acylhydrolase [Spiroplasma poulsonii]PWF96996.1 GDSL-like Lipase/Acylhydrolase [Spiroplasma poulsonii]
MKKKIAILGDSLTFGYLPMGSGKMPEADNWPAKLANLLTQHYQTTEIEIQTNAQPGRTIIKPLIDFGFPQDNGMNSLLALYQKASPFDLFIVFLGTNDYFGYDAYAKLKEIADYPIEEKIVTSLGQLINQIKNFHRDNHEEINYKILVVCPPKALTMHNGELLTSLPSAYQKYFANLTIPVVNLQLTANPHVEDQTTYDGIHYTPSETSAVAQAIFDVIINDNLLAVN